MEGEIYKLLQHICFDGLSDTGNGLAVISTIGGLVRHDLHLNVTRAPASPLLMSGGVLTHLAHKDLPQVLATAMLTPVSEACAVVLCVAQEAQAMQALTTPKVPKLCAQPARCTVPPRPEQRCRLC